MSNLAQSQSAWNQVFREFALMGLSQIKLLREIERRFALERNRTQIVEANDVNLSASLWSISGVVVAGTNADEDLKLYVRITKDGGGAGTHVVDAYRAAGGSSGDKVLTGSGANGATVALSAANASGLTGSVKLGTIAASESDDKHQLWIFLDYPLRLNVVFDGSHAEHGALLEAGLQACRESRAAISAAVDSWKNALSTFISGRFANFLRSGSTAAVSVEAKPDDGAILTDYSGVLVDAKGDMLDELTAGAQAIVQNAATAGSPAFDSRNQGTFTMAAPTLEEWARDGAITLVCVDGNYPEKFKVTQRVTTTGELREGLNDLTLGRAWADPVLGIRSWTLSRLVSVTNTSGGSSDLSTTASDWSFAGETNGQTADGVWTVKVVSGGGSTFYLEGYKATSLDASMKVWTSTAATAGSVVTISQANSSGISGTGKLGSAPTAAHTATINLNPARTKNTNGIADKITCQVTVTGRGEFQDRVAELFDYALASTTSGSETIDDSYISSGTFFPFEVRDA